MNFRALVPYLLPGEAEREESFAAEIRRLSDSGLRLLGFIEIAVALFLLLAQLLLEEDRSIAFARVVEAASSVAVGVVTIALASLSWGYVHARLLAMVSALVSAALLIAGSLVLTPGTASDDHYIAGHIAILLLAVVGTVPLLPIHTFTLGSIIGMFNLAALSMASRAGLTLDSNPSQIIFILLLTMLSTGLSALFYAQRREGFDLHEQSLKTTAELYQAHSRAKLAETAVSVGRLAAALTHELNTPLGALSSAVDTMLVIVARQANSPPEEQRRLVAVQGELRRSIRTSADRLSSVISRLQRFVELDTAEKQMANLNELLNDVAILFEGRIHGKVKVDFNFDEIPPLECRPQQLSAVFANLVSNALNAVDGEGTILVSTHRKNSHIEVNIRDTGKGMTPEEVANIFDPGFRVSDGRVSTGNWSLFSCRQILHEHGGEIKIHSRAGEGTTVSVSLPCAPSASESE